MRSREREVAKAQFVTQKAAVRRHDQHLPRIRKGFQLYLGANSSGRTVQTPVTKKNFSKFY